MVGVGPLPGGCMQPANQYVTDTEMQSALIDSAIDRIVYDLV